MSCACFVRSYENERAQVSPYPLFVDIPRLGSKLLNYHGLSAINITIYPSWDSFFTALLEQVRHIHLSLTLPSYFLFHSQPQPVPEIDPFPT